ncbi:MAG: PEP-CTERM sorting domain-containing protein [Nitrospirae bacterium]|nr:PEP-CTERM sorting domain-containing protein [Nitrospirota bacterium]MDA1305443.1 PEP-CTERM sorting domain-containing protein [Nitrospirota bacterium]
MTHTTTNTTNQGSRWLRAGLTSLILGVGALSLTASQAFALQVSVADTQNVFTVMEQSGPLNGVDDKVYTEFDFSGVDWNTVTLNSAMLELHLTVVNGLTKSDEILFGDTLNGGATDLASSILGGVDLFDQTGLGPGTFNPLSFGLPVPSPGDMLVLNLDLNDFWDNADLQNAILGGDSLGKIYMKYSDDALVTSATLTLGYDDPSLDDPQPQGCTVSCDPTPNPVPEPSTMILLGSGLMGLVAWRKRHQG